MSSIYRLLYRTFSASAPLQNETTVLKSLSSELYKERSLKRVAENFKKCSESPRFRTKTGVYEDIIRRLASAKRYRLIEEILEDQKQYDDMSKEGFASRIINLYGKSGMFENAQKVFDEMHEKNCTRTVMSFNALLGACVGSKKYDKIEDLFKVLPKKFSIKPDLVSYNTLIKAFCEMNSLDSAVSALDEMEKLDVEPDLITFNTLLNGIYMKGKFSDGETIYNRMLAKPLLPDIRTYNAKLIGLAKEKKTKETVELFHEMVAKKVKPDAYTYNYLITGFAKEGNLEEAKRWYEEMKKKEIVPDKRTYSILLPFLCEKVDMDSALDVCKEIFSRRCLVNGAMLQSVVDGLVKVAKIEEAKEVLKLGNENNYKQYHLKMPSEV